MKDIKITVMRKAEYRDLIEKYENPVESCQMKEGMVFVAKNGTKPKGFCNEAWKIISPFASELARGGGDFFDGWMKNEHSAMVSCNDGFRPVSYLVETI